MTQPGLACLYIIECEHDVLYVGVTTDPLRRMFQHWSGLGALATRTYKPISYKVLAFLEVGKYALLVENRLVRHLQRQNKKAFGGGYTNIDKPKARTLTRVSWLKAVNRRRCFINFAATV